MDNEISAFMDTTMSKIKELVDTNTVVGEPIITPDDITLIPLSRVSFGFASGGSEFPMKDKNGVGYRERRQRAHDERPASGLVHDGSSHRFCAAAHRPGRSAHGQTQGLKAAARIWNHNFRRIGL